MTARLRIIVALSLWPLFALAAEPAPVPPAAPPPPPEINASAYILIDYDQATQYDPLRIVAHETGHDLGLPDHYSGPCSELMSGGGPGPSCTNPYPNSTESNQVDALWANGFAAAFSKAAFGSVK